MATRLRSSPETMLLKSICIAVFKLLSKVDIKRLSVIILLAVHLDFLIRAELIFISQISQFELFVLESG